MLRIKTYFAPSYESKLDENNQSCARIYRPSFHENKPKTLVFT
jgi:hypothetical protein